jgi:prevent-host-death family protein
MDTVGIYEAKTHFAQLIDRVVKGEQITITRHGVPVAVLCPAGRSERRPVKEVIAELKRFRRAHPLKGITIKELIEEGRD